MIEPVSLRALNRRMAELVHYCELQKNNPRKAVLDEISELNVIRDELEEYSKEPPNGRGTPHTPYRKNFQHSRPFCFA